VAAISAFLQRIQGIMMRAFWLAAASNRECAQGNCFGTIRGGVLTDIK
jgi:hypothetical protein